jgi:hypothetical protein
MVFWDEKGGVVVPCKEYAFDLTGQNQSNLQDAQICVASPGYFETIDA